MTATCKDCGWEGDEDTLERFRCPDCGSRQLRTEGRRRSTEDGLEPPEGARQGE